MRVIFMPFKGGRDDSERFFIDCDRNFFCHICHFLTQEQGELCHIFCKHLETVVTLVGADEFGALMGDLFKRVVLLKILFKGPCDIGSVENDLVKLHFAGSGFADAQIT